MGTSHVIDAGEASAERKHRSGAIGRLLGSRHHGEGQGELDDRRGRQADTPWQMPLSAWKEVALRSWREAGEDDVALVAAGVAFYGFVALVPMLGAIVLAYGLFAEPSDLVRHMDVLTSILPVDAARLIGDALAHIMESSGGKKGFGLLAALAVALFGARNGAAAIIKALNIAYEEKETRGFVKLTLLALGMTAAGAVVAAIALAATALLADIGSLLPALPDWLLALLRVVFYLLAGLAAAGAAATVYRYGPARQDARWVWLTPGSIFAGALWLLLTLGFGLYVSLVGRYDATYGSLGGVIALLTWFYLSAYVLIFGAELNSELEHQTAQDSTEGAPLPLGARGAWVADHVAGEPAEEEAAGAGRDKALSPKTAGSDPEPEERRGHVSDSTSSRHSMLRLIATVIGIMIFRRIAGKSSSSKQRVDRASRRGAA